MQPNVAKSQVLTSLSSPIRRVNRKTLKKEQLKIKLPSLLHTQSKNSFDDDEVMQQTRTDT